MAGIDGGSKSQTMQGGNIVNNMSMGILLHGLIHVRNERDERHCIVSTDKLLENVKDHQVQVSTMNVKHGVETLLYDQTESMEFREHLIKTRKVIGGGIGLSVPGFGQLDIGIKKGIIKLKKKGQAVRKKTDYLSNIKLIIMHKLSLKLNADAPLYFSEPVLSSLEKIVKTGARKEEYTRCRDFFKKYGSHVDLGECRLGGMIEIVSECKNKFETGEITDDDETMTENLINMIVGGGYILTGNVKITAAALQQKQVKFKVVNGRNLQNYELTTAIFGGEDKCSIQAWANSLEGDNLNIIDRGCLTFIDGGGGAEEHQDPMPNHISVWELLRKPPYEGVLEPFSFEEAAKKTEVFYKTFLYRERIIEITKGIETGPTALMFYNKLLDIFRVNEWRKDAVGNLNEWGEFIEDDDTILNFIKNIDSLSELRKDICKKIKQILQTLMMQVADEHKTLPQVEEVQKRINSMHKKFSKKILKYRDKIETIMVDNIDSKDGVEYNEALKTILKNVKKLEKTGDDRYWISMLKMESVSQFLLKPKKYMIMTVQTFKEICGTIEKLTHEPAFLRDLSNQTEISDLIFGRNHDLNRKIEFRDHVRKCVDLEGGNRTAKGYKKALEYIRDGVNKILHTQAERSKALAEMLKEDERVEAFLQEAGTVKTNRKTLLYIIDIVYELLAHVEYIGCSKEKRNIETKIKNIEEQLQENSEAFCSIL